MIAHHPPVGAYAPPAVTRATTVAVPRVLVKDTRQQFRAEVFALLDAGSRDFVLDCRETVYIDSLGLGVLVTIAKRVRGAGGSVAIQHLSDDLRVLFAVTRMDTLYPAPPHDTSHRPTPPT
jgi:anti-anti-sigma factor